jgi:hypothetical protein
MLGHKDLEDLQAMLVLQAHKEKQDQRDHKVFRAYKGT